MAVRKNKKYTVIIKIERDEEPDSEWVTVEGIGKGRILHCQKSDAGRWLIEASFQVNSMIEILVATDDKNTYVSKALH